MLWKMLCVIRYQEKSNGARGQACSTPWVRLTRADTDVLISIYQDVFVIMVQIHDNFKEMRR